MLDGSRQRRSESRRQIERREDGERVAEREQCVAGGREGARGDGSEHFGELAVLVQRQGQVDETDGAEFAEPAARGAGGLMLRGGADGVHCVSGEIGATV